MENFLILKDTATMTQKDFRKNTSIIEPISYECSSSLSSGNDFALKLPYRPSDNIAIGDWLDYPSDVAFSGIIYSMEIDKKKGVVTYKGMSALGVLDGCPKPGTAYQPLYLFDPEGNRASYYTDDDPSNPLYNAKNVLQHFADHAGYPIRFTESQYIPQATFEAVGKDFGHGYIRSDSSVLTAESLSTFGLLKRYYERSLQKPVISRDTRGVPDKVFNIDLKPREKKTYVVTDEAAIFTTSMNYNGARNSSYLSYITGYNPGNVDIKLVNNMPCSNALYKGFLQRHNYLGHEDDISQDDLESICKEYLTTTLVDGKISIDPSKIEADLGDLIEFYDPDLGLRTQEKQLTEKILTITKDSVNLDFTIGG